MRKPAANLVLGLTLVLLLAAVTLGQTEEKKKPGVNDDLGSYLPSTALVVQGKSRQTEKTPQSLEDTLSQVLHQNPDIRVAEAKLREAEAELQRVRLQVMQKAITLYHSLESERAAVRQAEEKLTWSKRMASKGFESDQSVKAAAAALAQAKSKLAAMEAELPALLGKLPRLHTSTTATFLNSIAETRALAQTLMPDAGSVAYLNVPSNLLAIQGKTGEIAILDPSTGRHLSSLSMPAQANTTPPARNAIADKIRQALDKPITLRLHDKALDDVLQAIQAVAPGISFHKGITITTEKANFTFEQIPLGAVLQALEDTFTTTESGAVVLVVRDYGILVTTRNFVPVGATLLQDFWKGTDSAGRPKSNPAGSSNRPAPDVEGVIKAVDAKAGLVTLSIGSDAGLQKGQTLEEFRLGPPPQYLGKLEVIELSPTQSVGKPQPRAQAAIHVGDRVSGSVIGR
jgi:hypothetical protein